MRQEGKGFGRALLCVGGLDKVAIRIALGARQRDVVSVVFSESPKNGRSKKTSTAKKKSAETKPENSLKHQPLTMRLYIQAFLATPS